MRRRTTLYSDARKKETECARLHVSHKEERERGEEIESEGEYKYLHYFNGPARARVRENPSLSS